MFTLRDITDAYYDELKYKECLHSLDRGLDEEDDTSKRINFYQDKVKNFKTILHAVDLIEEMDKLKELSSNNYDFDLEGKNFILMLLREFAGKLDPLRRGEIYKLDSEFILTIYKGFLHVFEAAGADQNLLESVSVKLYNRLDVPVRMVQSTREAASKRLECMIAEKMSSIILGMNTLENYAWLVGMRQDLNALIQKWSDLYDIMSELRQMELNDQAEVYAKEMSEEEMFEATLDWEFSGEIMKAQSEDYFICDLLKRKSELTGIPFEKLGLAYVDYKTAKVNYNKFKHKKKKFVKDIEASLEKVNKELFERGMEIRTEVIKKHIPEYEPPKETESEPDFSGLISAEELLEKAFEEQKEDWKWEEEHRKRAEVVLPEKSLEEIRKELDALLPIGTLGHFGPNIEEE